jgi:hypothetical protein
MIYNAFMINAPSYMFYSFISGGLTWLWNELAQEVEALAVADGVAVHEIKP